MEVEQGGGKVGGLKSQGNEWILDIMQRTTEDNSSTRVNKRHASNYYG